MRRFALSLFTIAGLSSLQACGAGLVGAFVASNNNSPPPAAPGLSLPESRFPLVPAATASTSFRTVVVANAQLQGTAGLQIEIRALGVRAVQGSPVIVSGQGGSTVVGFLLRTQEILAVAGDPTAQDLPGQLAVLASGVEVAPPVPVQLLKQPKAILVLPPQEENVFLSPLGGSRVTLAVSGLRAVQPGDLQVLVTTSDASGNSESITRQCTGIGLAPGPGADSSVSADVPGNTFSGQATLVVVDSVAGLSTAVTDAYYRPEITVALPGQGPTTGGSLVTLIGRALAPLDKATQPPTPAFDQVEILFRKGPPGAQRELVLAPVDLRIHESDLDRLVFTMPASPDGRPGQVDIVLRVRLGTVLAAVTAPDVFTFANPQPVFGPRGAVLDRLPVASAPIRLESAPDGTDAPDFALLYSEAGVGFLQLLTAEENGMFIRFGGSRQLGNPANAAERDPKDLGIGDFDGDGVPDILAINGGSAIGTHHLTLGQPRPKPPLGAIARIDADPAARRCVAADLDRDGKQDFVLLPGATALPGALPSVWLARPRAQGDPAFLFFGNVPVRPGLREQILVQDLDGDGFLDVAVAAGGWPARCDIAYGRGDGSFTPGQQVDPLIINYGPDTDSAIVGLHACGNAAPRPLVMVFATRPPEDPPPPQPPPAPPALAVMLPLTSRTYDPVVAGDSQPLPPAPLVASLSANLDLDDVPELVLAFRTPPDGPLPFSPLVLARWTGTSFQPVAGGVEQGSEDMFNIKALHFGTAFPPDQVRQLPVMGVFVLHESTVDGVTGPRLSTLLVSGPPVLLLAPDAGGQVPFAVMSMVGGSFAEVSRRTNGRTRDMALGTDNEVRILKNDGAGGFFSLVNPGQMAPRIVPSTLTRMQAPTNSTGVDSLAWLDRDSRLSVWLPHLPTPPPPNPPPPPPPPTISAQLRLLSPTPRLRTADVADSSRMVSADVDGDSVFDLVVMLTFQVSQPGEGDALLFVLRGKATVQSGEFPFHLPTSSQAVTLLHGKSTSVALADFVRSASGTPLHLEAAVAVPTSSLQGSDGDHVRFYRYAPAEYRLVRSSAGGPAALLAGDAPTHVMAADFDNNGTDDLLVAAAGDSTLRLFLNSGDPGTNPDEVNVAAFRESLTSPRPVAPGAITSLRLGDINGDRNVDALVSTQSGTATRSSAVAYYLSDGTGSFANPVFVSPTRMGNRDAVLSIDLSDFNGDSQLDQAAAWNTFGSGDRNVRVLFGGSR